MLFRSPVRKTFSSDSVRMSKAAFWPMLSSGAGAFLAEAFTEAGASAEVASGALEVLVDLRFLRGVAGVGVSSSMKFASMQKILGRVEGIIFRGRLPSHFKGLGGSLHVLDVTFGCLRSAG